MTKIKVSQTGEVDIQSVESLSRDELSEWIKLRLHDKDTVVPMDFRQGDTPYYLISLLYPKLNRYVREDIHQIVDEFVTDMARNPKTDWRGEAGHQLLLLVQSVSLDQPVELLVEMADAQKFFDKDAPSLAEDLHYRILQTLVAFGHRLETPDFWRKQYALAPERYAGVAFDGLALISLDKAMAFFSTLTSAEIAEDLLFTSFPSLLEECGIRQVKPIVEAYLPKMRSDVRLAVIEFFVDEGYVLQHELASAQFARSGCGQLGETLKT